jgi:predicted nucleotidyltransferase
MPVRSSGSSVLRWPDARTVTDALGRWAADAVSRHPELRRIGYFGSYARGNWGVGSDLDLILVVARSDEPFSRRAARWSTAALPVPADVLVYTTEEWERLRRDGRTAGPPFRDVVWVRDAERDPAGP